MKHILLTTVALAMSLMAMSIPARRGAIVKTQPDGTAIKVYLHGDEHFHWLTNEKGEWLKENEQGFYQVTEPLTDEQILNRRTQSRRYVRRSFDRRKEVGGRNIAPRGLIVLVNFKDKSFSTSFEEMKKMLTGDTYTRNYSFTYEGETFNVSSSGSARQYFYDTSNGQYNPQFDIIGPVAVSKNMSYYGGNDSNGDDKHPEELIVEACKLADSQHNVDFSKYDNDGDGIVDFVYVFYAGYGEADSDISNTIWPHSWNLTEANVTLMLDDKQIDLYACGSEMNYISKKHDGIGTFCHEFSHVLGLPDFYETTNNGTWKTMGAWDIMDYGPYNNDGNTPPLYSGYERFYMGWTTPRVLNKYEEVTLNSNQDNGEVLLITSTGKHNLDGLNPNPSTFYVIENRQQKGWDEYLPGHGMLLTKVQYSASKWEENTVNNTKKSLGVDIIEADGKAPSYSETNRDNGYFGKAKDAFPAGATSYTKISGYPIRDIKENNGVITFRFMDDSQGGGNEDDDDVPQSGGEANACESYSYTFTTKAQYGSSVQLGDYSWSLSAENETYSGYMADKGAQFGSNKQPAISVELTTAETADCMISRVEVEASIGSKGNGKLQVLVNGEALGGQQSLTTTPTQYTFRNTADLKGNLTIWLSNTAKAMYISNINIYFKATSTSVAETKQNIILPQKRIEDGRLIIRFGDSDYDILGNKIK